MNYSRQYYTALKNGTAMPMNIILAGFNIDSDTVDEIREHFNRWRSRLAGKGAPRAEDCEAVLAELNVLAAKDNLTPETLSAAYARISRNPAPVHELRKIAREEVDKARKSNTSIIFDLGHSSVAEHAVFNIDVIGVSRYITEEIEKFRLNAYTEKSQRYILLKDDYVVPEEIRKSPHAGLFRSVIERQNALYRTLYDKLLPYVYETNPGLAKDGKNKSRLSGLAKEDARYILALAVEAQLGMTVNARNLEKMLSRTASHELAEVREFSRRLYDQVAHVAPSVIKYPQATDYFQNAGSDIRNAAEPLLNKYSPGAVTTEQQHPYSTGDVTIWQFTPQPHIVIAASLLNAHTNRSMHECLNAASRMTKEETEGLFRASWRRMQSWDSVPRAFENIAILYEITLSASCFGQMKRHRMTTQLCQPYDPSLGVTVPDSVKAVGMEKAFRDTIAQVEETYEILRKDAPPAAPYILTNAHRKRMLLQVNARELYHISRLREDEHAQWDIRRIAHQMVELARKAVPAVFAFACGKDRFEETRKRLFGGEPPAGR